MLLAIANTEEKLDGNNAFIKNVPGRSESKVCWKLHIKYVKHKLSKCVSSLFKVRDLRNISDFICWTVVCFVTPS